jgi:hypothetical protein
MKRQDTITSCNFSDKPGSPVTGSISQIKKHRQPDGVFWIGQGTEKDNKRK